MAGAVGVGRSRSRSRAGRSALPAGETAPLSPLRGGRGRLFLAVVAVVVAVAVLGLVASGIRAGSGTKAPGASRVATQGAAMAITTTTITTTGAAGTQVAVGPVAAAAQALAATVQAGTANATIAPGAGRHLLAQLQPLLGPPFARPAELRRFNRLAQTVYDDLTNRTIKGAPTTDALAGNIASLAFALGAPVPYPSATPVTAGHAPNLDYSS